MKRLGLGLILSLFSYTASGKVLFEGWFDVYLGAKKVGYSVQRYEFGDGKFKAVTYLKTNAEGGNITESLKAFSAPDLKPISYSYTSKAGDAVKLVDATFKGESMTLKINDGKAEKKEAKKIKKGTFLSTFLLYLMMSQENGLSVGKNYAYYAIAEEDGTTQNGKALVSGKEKVKGKEALKVLNEFKGDRFFSFVTPTGEFLLTRNPTNNIEMRRADSQEAATKDFTVDKSSLKLLFGTLPGDQATAPEPKPAPTEEKK
ncbi:MAG: hypothetical protein IT289_02875 [Oligoflexia bacterium]|nr:hypothetical protein [Oligoflexia bacterium]